jgi:ADP-ribose pyrophosphatase YjhB (NUDIX family)
VAAVIIAEGSLLLVRQSRGTGHYHLLPGGGVETGESLETALVREVAEETGLLVRLVRPLFVSDSIAPDRSRHLVNLTFLVAIEAGEITLPPDPSILGLDLVSRSELTSIDLRPPLAEHLARAWAADFDVPASYLGPLWKDEPS